MIGALIGGALGAVSSVLGSSSRNSALRRQRRLLMEQQRENDNWYNRRYNEDATGRADAQRLLSITADAIRRRNREAAGVAAVMGGSDEGVAAVKEANAKALSDTAGRIAAQSDARRDAVEREYMRRKSDLDGQLRGVDAQVQSGWDMVGGALGGAVGGALGGAKVEDVLRGRQEE